MPIRVAEDQLTNLTEIYALAENVVEVVTANHRTIRITAKQKVRGPLAPFWAAYDELVHTTIDGEACQVWVRGEFPWAKGDTIEQCLRSAMFFVNEAGASE